MESVVICPVCGHHNSPEVSRCAECWANVAEGAVVSQGEASELASDSRRAGRRRRLLRWALIGIIILAFGAWVAERNTGVFQSLPSPSSNITASPAPGNWPMYQRDHAHTAAVADPVLTPRGDLVWSFATSAPITSSPAVVDGRVYLTTGDRRVVVLDAESGAVIWERPVAGPVDSSPAVVDDFIFVGLRNNKVLALSRRTGETVWEFRTGNPIFSSPAVHGGIVYIGSGDGRLYALDAVTGEQIWSFLTRRWVVSSPAVYEDVVAVTSRDRYLYILDARTGKLRLDYLIGMSKGSPVFDGKTVFVADEGAVRAIDWTKRDPFLEKLVQRVRIQFLVWGWADAIPPQAGYIWNFRDGADSFSTAPVVAWDKVFAASASGRLIALDKRTGEKVWEFPTEAALEAPPSVGGKTVYVGDVAGRLYAVDALTGEKQWEYNTGGPVSSTPVLANGMLFVASLDGVVYAIRP